MKKAILLSVLACTLTFAHAYGQEDSTVTKLDKQASSLLKTRHLELEGLAKRLHAVVLKNHVPLQQNKLVGEPTSYYEYRNIRISQDGSWLLIATTTDSTLDDSNCFVFSKYTLTHITVVDGKEQEILFRYLKGLPVPSAITEEHYTKASSGSGPYKIFLKDGPAIGNGPYKIYVGSKEGNQPYIDALICMANFKAALTDALSKCL